MPQDDAAIQAALKKRWANTLSRYAGFLGQAVPAFRLEAAEFSLDGVALSTLEPRAAIEELWKTRFPYALLLSEDIQEVDVTEFPLLYVESQSGELFLLRGRAGKAGYLVEGPSGDAEEKTSAEILAQSDGVFGLTPTETLSAADTNQRSATQWFMSSLLAYRPVFIEALFGGLLASFVGLGAAMYTMQVYDRVVPTQGYSTLTVLTIGVMIAILFELIIKQSRAYMVDRVSKAIDQDLSAVFFGKALDIRLDARPGTIGTFASQIRNFESVRNFLTSSTLFMFADAPFAIFFIGIIALIGGKVALVPIIVFPILLFIGLLFRKPIEHYSHLNMEESHKKNGLLIESIDGIESLKAVNADWKVLAKWRALTQVTATSELKLRSLSSLSGNLTQTFQQISYTGMVAFGAYLITLGELSMGGLIACSIIGGRALSPLSQIPTLIVQWQQAKLALTNLDSIMALPGERQTDLRLLVPDQIIGNLQLKKASFSYDPDGQSVSVDALSIQPGERVAILGAVGSGKSTLLKLLGGFVEPQEGQLLIDDLDLFHVAPEIIREKIGYLPQDVRLFSGTLRDNLLLGLPLASDSKILEACQSTGLAQAIRSHPKGLDLPISEGGKGLSGGQRQLVGITRMLLAQPKILIMDEPTASMDAQSEARVMRQIFDNMPADHSIIVVTHKPGLLPNVDRVLVMNEGRIVMDGPRDAVLGEIKQRVEKQVQKHQNRGAPTAASPSETQNDGADT
jgi:ATP-binding cassette subfamily C protein LapB